MLLIFIGVLSAALSHIALKHAAPNVIFHGDFRNLLKEMFTNGWFLLGAVLHLLSLFLWLFGLRRTDLSLAHPMIALSLVVVILYSWVAFKRAARLAQDRRKLAGHRRSSNHDQIIGVPAHFRWIRGIGIGSPESSNETLRR